MKALNVLFLVLFISVGTCTQAQDPDIITDVIAHRSLYPAILNNDINYTTNSTPKNVDISTIIAIGKAIWEIIEKGKPVVDYKLDWGGAVPKNVEWHDLEKFKHAKWGPFGWTFTNSLKKEIVRFKWNFGFNCKGSYNGHGMFLTDVVTAVSEIYAAWGFNVSAKAIVGQTPTNYGTKIDPIAGLPVEVTINVKSTFQSFTERCTVVIKGDCTGIVVSY